MSFFNIPGWSVDGKPAQEPERRKSRSSDARSRPAEINLDKTQPVSPPKDAQNHVSPQASGKKRKRANSRVNWGKELPVSSQLKHEQETGRSASETPSTISKKSKPSKIKSVTALTDLQKGMKDSLDGARFRLINEQLYKSDSQCAHAMMKNDPNLFEEYHTRFRHQVKGWKQNPVDYFVDKLVSYPHKTLIADLGCGDAALAKKLLGQGMNVISFDLVSQNAFVVEADICNYIPLPGSLSDDQGAIVDVAVCALSLMGLNWLNCVRESWRILKPGGELYIAEVTSRFVEIKQFQNVICSVGFRMKRKDLKNSHFALFEFIKIPAKDRTKNDWDDIMSHGGVLKPCEYKRR